MPILSSTYNKPPFFLVNGHLETIYPSLFRKVTGVEYFREKIDTPDGDWDFVDKVFFKGTELEIDFDAQWTTGKALTVQLWTLKDVD